MRVLITGVNGYVGKSLYDALSKNWTYDVVGINRDTVELTDPIEVCNFFQQQGGFEVILHCAASGVNNVKGEDWDIMDENLLMYYNLLANKHHYRRLIHFGSGAETYMPKQPYGYSKKVIAKSILNQDNFYNLKLFGVFDENELDTRFIKANIKRYINKEPLQIYEHKLMDFFYMQDLVKVVEYYIKERNPPKEFDCVYKDTFELRFIASMINLLDDYQVEVKRPLYGVLMDPYISKYRTELPIEFIGLHQGIKNTYKTLRIEAN